MAVATLNIGTEPQKRGALVFTSATDIGPQVVLTLPLVQFAPSGGMNFIGDEYGTMEITGEVLAVDGSFGTLEHPDDAVVNPDVLNYYVGTGVVTWTPEGGSLRDIGNCQELEFSQEAEPLDHWNRRGGIRVKDYRPIVQQNATIRMVLDEWSAENLRLAMMAA